MLKQILLEENEKVRNQIKAYYKYTDLTSLAMLSGNTSNSPDVLGLLLVTNRRIIFYTEVMKVNKLLFEIDYKKIIEVKKREQTIGLFKKIPSIAICHEKGEEIFSTMGDLEQFSELQCFFDEIKLGRND
ncbi:PH domain-containing protein [Bacillus cereus]|uniref:PH domain-containing protein n=1 Tax=Bacillus cereus TaxID=1396 RepID=UPI00397F333E